MPYRPAMSCKHFTCGALLPVALFIAGCGGGGDGGDTSLPGDLDKLAPTVTYVTPSNGANEVGTNTRLTVTFSEPMDERALAAAVGLVDETSGAAVALQDVAFDRVNNIATITPRTPLAPDRTYRGAVSTAARDLGGNALARAYAWRFGSAAAADTTAPTVSSHAPAAGAAGAATGTAVAMSFSEPMDVASVNAAFTLTGGGAVVSGRLAYVGQAAVFSPAAALAPHTRYVATLRRSATDLAGNGLTADNVWSFDTGPGVDTTAPSVLSVSPSPAATNVRRQATLSVSFSEPIFPFVYGSIDGVVVDVAIDYASNTASVMTTVPLRANARYDASVRVSDLAGNAMDAPYRWEFVTAP